MKKNLKTVIRSLVSLILIIYLIGLGVVAVYLYLRFKGISQTLETAKNTTNGSIVTSIQPDENDQLLTCNQYCYQEIEDIVNQAVATLSSSTKETIIEKQTVVNQPTGGSDFIPMGTTFSTTSTSWVDVPDSVVYFDLINDYGDKATVSWESSLKVAYGSGKAFARLYDGTNNIAVDYSEISTENNSEFQRVTTGNLPFWRGHNLYKVQIKSLNSFLVTYSGGKIKVSY